MRLLKYSNVSFYDMILLIAEKISLYSHFLFGFLLYLNLNILHSYEHQKKEPISAFYSIIINIFAVEVLLGINYYIYLCTLSSKKKKIHVCISTKKCQLT